MREFQIGTRRISDDTPCFVVAEIGNNHGGDVDTAQAMVKSAATAGADAVKFQLRTNATLYTPDVLNTPYDHAHSFGKTYGEHRNALELTRDGLSSCQTVAEACGVTCFATAFDETSADTIAELKMPAVKLASGSLTDLVLQRHVASLGLPIILSTGGGTLKDIERAVNNLAGRAPLALLHCTAAYPVRDFAELNLQCITTLRERYPELVIGWSGHDSGIAMAVAAYTLGARIIEKHFTLNRASKGTDHAFSLEPAGLKKLVRDLQRTKIALGDGVKRVYESEKAPIAKMRRRWIGGRWVIGTPQEAERAHAAH